MRHSFFWKSHPIRNSLRNQIWTVFYCHKTSWWKKNILLIRKKVKGHKFNLNNITSVKLMVSRWLKINISYTCTIYMWYIYVYEFNIQTWGCLFKLRTYDTTLILVSLHRKAGLELKFKKPFHATISSNLPHRVWIVFLLNGRFP